MVARVLVVGGGRVPDDVEQVVVPDGDAALALLDHEPFDAVVLDLALPPLDGWYVLAALGGRPPSERPRIVAAVPSRSDIPRARALGADLCVGAGTNLDARALERSTKEITCRQPPATSFPAPMTSGVSA